MNKWHRRIVILSAAAITATMAHSAAGLLIDTAGHWASPLIAALEAKGIVAGDPDGRFEPEAPLTRAQLAKLLVVGMGNEADAQLLTRFPSRFSDVPGWHWAKGYIESVAEMAVTEGYPDGSFGPADTVTRAQMATFLARVLGGSDEIWQMRLTPTAFTDDQEIPEWARGAVHVALANGLMNGFDDGSFRPLQPVTRAEAGVTLLRLLGRLGRAYHLAGTLTRFDPDTLQGSVRDELGQERTFVMAADAQYFRGGLPAQPAAVKVADQVWLVLGEDGKAALLEARYVDFVGKDAVVAEGKLLLTDSDGVQHSFVLQPGALIYLNGLPAKLSQLPGAPQVYLALDAETGDVRLADAVNAPISARMGSFNATTQTLIARVGAEQKEWKVSPAAVFFLNGQRETPEALRAGDRLQLAISDQGEITYLQAER